MSVYKKISSFSFCFFSFLVFRPSNGFVNNLQFMSNPLDSQKKLKTKMLSFYQQQSYFSQIVSKNLKWYFVTKIVLTYREKKMV